MSVSPLSEVKLAAAGSLGETPIVLIAAERKLRRLLFDTLDHAGYCSLTSARDGAHAAILTEGRLPPVLVVLAFEGDGRAARACCAAFAEHPQWAELPVMAVLSGDGRDAATLPERVVDWLALSRVTGELATRCAKALTQARHQAQAMRAAAQAQALLPFAFEEDGCEWLVIDAEDQHVIAASPAWCKHSALDAAAIDQTPWQQLIVLEPWAQSALLADRERRWYTCRRRSSQGLDAGRVNVRTLFVQQRRAMVLLFQSDRADQRAGAALNLLAGLATDVVDAQPMARLATRLVQGLALDQISVWQAPERRGGVPERLYPVNVNSPSPDDGQISAVLQSALAGIAHTPWEEPLADSAANFSDTAALPLLDERGKVLGALLLTRGQGLGLRELVQPLLEGAAASFAHVLERRRTRQDDRSESLLDALTGLPNQLLFHDRLDTTIREAQRSGECFAVIFLDLDHYAAINQSHGRDAGDRALQVITQRLCTAVRASDTVARFDADAFAIMLRHIVRTDDVLRVAEKMLQSVELPIEASIAQVGAPAIRLTASLGLSFFPDHAPDADTMLRYAEQAMESAQTQGGNQYQLYQLPTQQPQQLDVALISRLRQAERNGELEVLYQPQVDAMSEDIVGMEALLRWNQPELGPISPGVFIHLAERSGLIVSIGEWVLRQACRQAREWEDRYGLRLRLGVNLSAVQLMQSGLLATVAEVIEQTGIDAQLLELEITESISIKEMPHLLENLHGLHQLGCHIAIDDFGTGAASLDYLRRLPADRIKIDQSFVRNIGVDPDDEAIVRATIEMAHRLSRGVIAEGVEIEQHFEFLRANHCDELQGYLFSRPLTAQAFGEMLAEREQVLGGAIHALA